MPDRPTKRVRAGRVIVLAMLVAGLGGVPLILVPAVGPFLVVADPLEPADAIFVLEGGTPHRTLEAASLYHRGMAPRVVLSRGRDPIPPTVRRLAGEPSGQERAARILRHRSVPSRAIVRLEPVIDNTEQELRANFAYARAQGFGRVILVTSPYHTRRVRVMWNARYARELPAIVRPTSYEPVDPTRWWRSRRSLEEVTHELIGIGHFLVGGPLPTFDARP